MRTRYEDIEVGECFKFIPREDAPVYMKISRETDHNFDYVCLSERYRGECRMDLLDNEEVYPVKINMIQIVMDELADPEYL